MKALQQQKQKKIHELNQALIKPASDTLITTDEQMS
jgi:hypothetical protein